MKTKSKEGRFPDELYIVRVDMSDKFHCFYAFESLSEVGPVTHGGPQTIYIYRKAQKCVVSTSVILEEI